MCCIVRMKAKALKQAVDQGGREAAEVREKEKSQIWCNMKDGARLSPL